jgi:hypothetical protein
VFVILKGSHKQLRLKGRERAREREKKDTNRRSTELGGVERERARERENE